MNTRSAFARSSVMVAAAAMAGFGLAQTPPQQPPVTLKVGDLAPPLAVSKWVKGTPTTNLADGKVHVVEFWATWCGPCKGSMPKLSAAARRFRGLANFAGIDVWEDIHGGAKDPNAVNEKVERFVHYSGDTMDYNVATDTAEGTMAKTWLEAAGQRGIPATFVVDQQGKIAWIGHPLYGLDEIVDLVVKRKLDADTAAKVKADWKGRFTTFWDLSKQYDEAIKQADYTKALDLSHRSAELIPTIGEPVTMELGVLLRTDPKAARRLANESLKRFQSDPQTLLQISQTVLDASDKGATGADYALALKLAKAGAKRYPPNDPGSLRVLAQAYHLAGDKAQAVAAQKQYVEYISDPTLKVPQQYIDEARAKLKTFEDATN